MKEYFIAVAASTNQVPDVGTDTPYWVNLNLWATNAKNANFVKVLKNDTGTAEHYLTFVDSSNASPGNLEQLYTDTQLKYVPSENKLYTLAEFADKYKRTFTNALNLNTGTEQSPNHGAAEVSISGEFEQVYEHLGELYGGSGHTLTIQKNGVVIGEYDPSANKTINITIAHGDVTDWDQAVEDTGSNHFVRYDESQSLSQNQQEQARDNINAQIVGDYATLINGKVPSEQLPDWILGQMEYGGIVSLSSGADNGKIQSNNIFYNNKYLVKVPGENIAPWVSNTVYAINSYVTYNGLIYRYKTSYTGSTFDYTKVDILPTTIYFNENLKGTFSASTAYSAGNIVLYNGAYYMFHTNHAAGAWSAAQAVSI